MPSRSDDVLLEASFDTEAIVRYHWIGLVPVAAFIITIPIVIIVAIFYAFLLRRMVASWSATLTRRNLLVKRGVFNRVEKTIPLEQITDLSLVEGPVMRYIGVKRLSVETAGQTGGAGNALVSLLGVVDPEGFRERVLAQRDRISDAESPAEAAPNMSGAASSSELREIADTLRRIEHVVERLVTKDDVPR